MARTSHPETAANGRRRTRRSTAEGLGLVTQITQLVAANQTLQRANRELVEENRRLQDELAKIGAALGRPSPGRRIGRPATVAAVPTRRAVPDRRRKPITDPVVLDRRRQALAKARAARAEKLAAARAAGNASMPTTE